MKIGKKSAILFAIDLVILMMAVGICAADEVHVYPGNSIQDAVDNAAQGDIIIVHNGTYVENIDVNKEVSIVSDSGNPGDTIIHAFTFEDDVFDVTADNVTISGLTIEGASASKYAAVRLGADGVDSGKYNCLITDNILTNNYYGVKVLNWSHENEFNNNIIISNRVGISMDAHSQENSFVGNTLEMNDCCGIIIRNNHVDHTIAGNTILNNGDGIHFYYGSGSVLTGNLIDSNEGYGVDISRSQDMTLINNRISGNSKGILFNGFGAHTIYDNYFNNTQNLNTTVYNGSTTATVWNTTKAVGTNMIGGPYLGGNYWATPEGTGFSQTVVDADGDGICDLPCVIDENNTDYLPLSLQAFELMPPIADFTSNVTSGYAPLAVQFTDESANNAVSWEWDFGDGSLISNETNPVHLYAKPGTYNVSLTVGNDNGNDTELRTNYILVEAKPVEEDSSSGSSKSRGGGGGSSAGSGESYSNILFKEVVYQNVVSGAHVVYDFKDERNCIMRLEFDSKMNAGRVKATIEVLKDRSALVSSSAPGEVNQNVNIWVGNAGFATPDNIENAVVTFKIERTWLSENGIDESTIKLNRYHEGEWNPLVTSKVDEDGEYLYFESQTPGFSPFAITGDELVVVEETVSEEPLNTIADDTVADEVPEEPTPSRSKLLLGFIAPLAIGVIAYLKRDELIKWLKK